MTDDNIDESAKPPGLDPVLWNHRIFKDIQYPADWCTIRQAAEHQLSDDDPDERLRLIAEGKLKSETVNQDDAALLLEVRRTCRKEG